MALRYIYKNIGHAQKSKMKGMLSQDAEQEVKATDVREEELIELFNLGYREIFFLCDIRRQRVLDDDEMAQLPKTLGLSINDDEIDMIRKEMFVSEKVLAEVKRIVEASEIVREDDKQWPEPNDDGRQEFEVVIGNQHISFATAKIGSLLDVQDSADPEGLRIFYYLVQDLKCFVFSLIGLHFRIKPI